MGWAMGRNSMSTRWALAVVPALLIADLIPPTVVGHLVVVVGPVRCTPPAQVITVEDDVAALGLARGGVAPAGALVLLKGPKLVDDVVDHHVLVKQVAEHLEFPAKLPDRALEGESVIRKG